MPRFPLEYFSEGRAHAHLVIASVDAKSSSNADLREARRLLQRLVKGQSPAGQYRTLIVRESGTPELHCVFEAADDAKAVAIALSARPVPAQPGRSCWEARLDAELMRSLERTFPPGKGARPEVKDPGSLSLRVGASRTPRRWTGTRHDE